MESGRARSASKPELSVVSSLSAQSIELEGFRSLDDRFAFTPFSSDFTSASLDFASLAVPLTLAGRPVTLQASWRRLYALDQRENASTVRQPLSAEGAPELLLSSNSDTVGAVDLLSLAGAVKLTSRLALGGSFNMWRGDWTVSETVSAAPVDVARPAVFRSLRETNRLRGNSVSLGLLLTYPRWSIGVLHQGLVGGDFTGSLVSANSEAPSEPPESLTGRLYFPQALGIGVAWRPASNWTTAVDLTWDEWSEAALQTQDGTTVDLFTGVPPELSATRNTVSVNAGAERLFHGEGFLIPLHFGAAWEPQGARHPYTRDPVNYVLLAAGTGYNTNTLKFDACVTASPTERLVGSGLWVEGKERIGLLRGDSPH